MVEYILFLEIIRPIVEISQENQRNFDIGVKIATPECADFIRFMKDR